MEKRIEKRYSRAFKQFIVDEYEKGESVMKLIDMLEDLDDVQNVYTNAEFPEDMIA